MKNTLLFPPSLPSSGSHLGRSSLLVFTAGLLTLGSVSAASPTWDGSGNNDSDWTTKQNWGGNSTPAANDDLSFGGSNRLTNNNNTTAGQNYNSITFNSGAGAFILGGNRLTLGGDVTNNSANLQTINLALILSATRTFNAASGNLAVAGVISGSGGLTKSGANALTLSAVDTYTGQTTVSGGKLTIASTGTINSTSSISIGAGEFNYNSGTALSKGVSFSGTGGTLSGTGTITPAVAVSSSNTYSAGAVGDPGTQALNGGISFATGSIFSWDLDATTADTGANAVNSGTYDQVTGNGSGSGTFNVVLGLNHFTDAFWNTNKTWNNIFSGSDPTFSVFTGTDGISSVASDGKVTGQGQFSYSGTNLTWTAVPEPTSALAGILLGAGLLRRRR